MPTPEWKRPSLASVYALTKYVQEQLTLTLSSAYGMEGVALRLFNVYGPGQALSNPYTGVLAIFASRLLNGQRPLIFEDGQQRRDFVHVEDVARAFALALEEPAAAGQVFNVGSGEDRSILEIGTLLAQAMGRPDLAPGNPGQGAHGRHSSLLLRRVARRATRWASRRARTSAGDWRNSPNGWRGRRRRTGWNRRGASSKRGASLHERAEPSRNAPPAFW